MPYFGVALTATRYHEVMDHLKGEAGIADLFFWGNFCLGE